MLPRLLRSHGVVKEVPGVCDLWVRLDAVAGQVWQSHGVAEEVPGVCSLGVRQDTGCSENQERDSHHKRGKSQI